MNVSAFDCIYIGIPWFFRFPQNKIWQYSSVIFIKIEEKTQRYSTYYFFKIIFCQHSKYWFGPVKEEMLQRVNKQNLHLQINN